MILPECCDKIYPTETERRIAVYKILICEDDPVISSSMCRYLEAWGYEVNCVRDFKSVIEDFKSHSPDIVLMDTVLPFFNGYHWCTEIRRISNVPVVFVSSASDNMNIVMAMNMGADDFLAKPFDLDVLGAKVSAVLRRAYNMPLVQSDLQCRGAVLNKSDASLSYGGEKTELTKNEYRILEVLMENQGKIVSRNSLMDKLWETDSFIDDNTLTVNVTRIRHKLDAMGLSDFIKTKKGIGYMIEI